jgi:hypothetical protein
MSCLQLLNAFPIRHLALSRRHSLLLGINTSSRSLQLLKLSAGGTVESNHSVAYDINGAKCNIDELEAIALEILDVFILIQRGDESFRIIFINCNGAIVNITELRMKRILSMDYFQNRMELIIAQENGKAISLSIRQQQKHTSSEDIEGSAFQLYHRRIYQVMKPHYCVQIKAQDVPETCLLLINDGSIHCLDATTFESLWVIPTHSFYSKPSCIYPDRLTSHFLVFCQGINKDFSIEYWYIPHSFSLGGDTAQFCRASLPLEEPVVSARIESIGNRFGSFVVLILKSGKLFVWRWSDHLESLYFESYMLLPLCMQPSSSRVMNDVAFIKPTPKTSSSHIGMMVSVDKYTVLLLLHSLQGDNSRSYSAFQVLLDEELDRFQMLQGRADNEDFIQDMNPLLRQITSPNKVSRASHWQQADTTISDDLPVTPFNRLSHDITTMPLQPVPLLPSHSLRIIASFISHTLTSKVIVTSYPAMVISFDLHASEVPASWRSRYLTIKGLEDSPDALLITSLLFEPARVMWASRARMIATTSATGEVYLHCLLTNGGMPFPSPALKPPTCILLADIRLVPLPEDEHKLIFHSKPVQMVAQKRSGWVILCSGDSSGHVSVCVTDDRLTTQCPSQPSYIILSLLDRFSVLHSGGFQAHRSAIAAVLSTGDSMFPLLNVGVRSLGMAAYVNAVPGAALVTVSIDGEVRVWRPKLSAAQGEGLEADDVLSGCLWEFICTGVVLPFPVPTSPVRSAELDPICTTVLVTNADGSLVQWPLPGLVAREGAIIETQSLSLSSAKVHVNAIDSLNIWIEGGGSSVKLVDAQVECTDAMGIHMRDANVFTIGYTLHELKQLAPVCFMVTSSLDCSLVLWDFNLDTTKEHSLLKPIPRQRYHLQYNTNQLFKIFFIRSHCVLDSYYLSLRLMDTFPVILINGLLRLFRTEPSST